MIEKKNANIAIEELAQGFIEIRLSLIEYAMTHTLHELLTQSLDEVGAFVYSPIRFYHFVEPDKKTLSLQQWSSRTRKEYCRAAGKGTHYNIDQAGVWVDCLRQKKAVIQNDYASLPHKKGLPEGHAEVVRELLVPVIRKDKVVAILGVGNKPTDYTHRDVEIVSYLADVTWEIVKEKRADEALRKTTIELHERVKELSCLYGISRLVEEDDLTIDILIQRTVELIPPSWQYPEITCARIKLNNRSYKTKQFRKTDWVQSQKIRVNKKNIGVLEVFLLENKPEKGEGPFLREERSLLNAIAKGLGHIIEHKQANEALQKAHDELQLRVEERTKELAIQNQHLLNEIKERKKAEEKLQRSSEKIKLFAYSVAHDLKNPAIATHNLARILNKKFGDALTDRGKNICEQIQRSSEDIASLADKINIFISTKETPLDIRKISLKEVFQILKEEFSSQLNIRSIQWLIPGTIPDIIVADRFSIVRIFRNIIENSLKYGGDGLGKIEIGYRSTADVHIFTVTDDGQGLTAQDPENIFNWFQRKTNSTEIHGTGMGLAIVKEIVALHGGDVWQEPAKPKGVTFCVSLSRHLIPMEEDGQN
ncbi:MAG: GAF domain-containing sensor histidine kinase [Proteobacteria bacterium]|nr:GAF domain-containing sensor histidine kinase [Pseudomonadota bacterium]